MIHRNLLEKVKKANKDRKLKLAKENGFTAVEEFIKYLESNLEPEVIASVNTSISDTVLLRQARLKYKFGDKIKSIYNGAISTIPTDNFIVTYSGNISSWGVIIYYKATDTWAENITKVKVKPIIYDITILDRSGSMCGHKYTNSCKGIEKGYEALKDITDIDWRFSLIEFSDNGNRFHFDQVKSVPSNIDWAGATGGTPLHKTIISVLEKLVPVKGSKVLVKIYTDGDDTDSERYYDHCKELLSNLNKSVYTITFVGTKYDVEKIIKQFSLDSSNTLVIENSGKGFKEAFTKSMDSTVTYASKVSKGEDVSRGFYLEML